MKSAAEITVRGFVQGVGFRWFTDKKARELGLCGNVMNLSNGDVLVNVEGDKPVIEQFIQILHKGPAFSKVQNVQVSWRPASGRFSGFFIEQ